LDRRPVAGGGCRSTILARRRPCSGPAADIDDDHPALCDPVAARHVALHGPTPLVGSAPEDGGRRRVLVGGGTPSPRGQQQRRGPSSASRATLSGSGWACPI
jgi:hypothetical protein